MRFWHYGIPVVIYNPLSVERTDRVEVVIPWHKLLPDHPLVLGPDGREVQ